MPPMAERHAVSRAEHGGRGESRARRRGRAVAERAVDIARFYQSLLGDSPYPSLTVTLVESDLPGGHSPGYFALLNEPPLGAAVAPRNDPASFEQFPDFVLAHELAHQWWGQAVGWRSYHEQWLSEGFSQYFAALYAERSAVRRRDRLSRRHAPHAEVGDRRNRGRARSSSGTASGHIAGRQPGVPRARLQQGRRRAPHAACAWWETRCSSAGCGGSIETSRFRSVGTADFGPPWKRNPAGRSSGFSTAGSTARTAAPRFQLPRRTGSEVVLRIEQTGEIFDLPVTVTLQYATARRLT